MRIPQDRQLSPEKCLKFHDRARDQNGSLLLPLLGGVSLSAFSAVVVAGIVLIGVRGAPTNSKRRRIGR